jgi:uncharacterized membrane protein
MSLRTAIKYEFELGNTKCFNWKNAPIINPIINTIAEEEAEFSREDWVYSEEIEANREKLLANIDKIIKPDETWAFHEDLEFQLNNIEKYHSITREKIYNNLKELIEQSDIRNKYVYFIWE